MFEESFSVCGTTFDIGKYYVFKKNQLMSLFVFFVSLLIVAQHVSGQPCAHHQELTTA
jgi:hypothetical protein